MGIKNILFTKKIFAKKTSFLIIITIIIQGWIKDFSGGGTGWVVGWCCGINVVCAKIF